MTVVVEGNPRRLSGPVFLAIRGATPAQDAFIGQDGTGQPIMSVQGTNGSTFINIGTGASSGPLLGEIDVVAAGYISTSQTAAQNKSGFNSACLAAGTQYGLFVPAGTYAMSSGLNHPANTFRIRGAGPYATIFNFADHSLPGLSAGDATGTGYGSKVSDIQLAGPSAHPTSDGNQALVINGAPFTTMHNIIVSNFDIGYDWINNCYGSRMDVLQAQYGLCNVACNIRVGAQSGNDLYFTDCWFGGAVAGVSISGGTGYHFAGGQISAGTTVPSGAPTPIGPVIPGKDYLTGTVSGMGTADFRGVDFEGFLGYGFVSYGGCGPIQVEGCTFLATNGSPFATGILQCNSPAGSFWMFLNNILGDGTFSAASGMLNFAGSAPNSNFALIESNWQNQFPLTINGDSSAWFTSLAEQSGLTTGAMGFGVGRFGDAFVRSGTTRYQISATGQLLMSEGVAGGKTNGQTYTPAASPIVGQVDLAAQGAAQSSVAITFPGGATTAPVTGFYRVRGDAKVTRAATTSSTLGGAGGLTFTYTDGDLNASQTVQATVVGGAGSYPSGNTVGIEGGYEAMLYIKAGSTLTFSYGYTSSGATTMQYALHLRLMQDG